MVALAEQLATAVDVEVAPLKVARDTANLANLLHEWVTKTWPETYDMPSSVWLTGSSIWSVVCGDNRNPESDLDLFVTTDSHLQSVAAVFRAMHVEPATPRKPRGPSVHSGERIHTARGWVDVWTSDDEDVFFMLNSYPSDSHAHCRAAYQPKTRALVIIANDKATPDGFTEAAERQSCWWAERAIERSGP